MEKKTLKKYLDTFYSLTGKLQMITVPQRNVFGNLYVTLMWLREPQTPNLTAQ